MNVWGGHISVHRTLLDFHRPPPVLVTSGWPQTSQGHRGGLARAQARLAACGGRAALPSVLCPLSALVVVHPHPSPSSKGSRGPGRPPYSQPYSVGGRGHLLPGEALHLRRVPGDRADPPSGRLFPCQDDSGEKEEEGDVLVRKRTYARKTLKAPPEPVQV